MEADDIMVFAVASSLGRPTEGGRIECREVNGVVERTGGCIGVGISHGDRQVVAGGGIVDEAHIVGPRVRTSYAAQVDAGSDLRSIIEDGESKVDAAGVEVVVGVERHGKEICTESLALDEGVRADTDLLDVKGHAVGTRPVGVGGHRAG